MKAVDEVKKHLSAYISLPPGYAEKRIRLARRVDDSHMEFIASVARKGITEDYRAGIRWKRNSVGRILGISGCSHCGDTWNWKKNHNIPCYLRSRSSAGMFPYCEQCHRSISKLRKMWYVLCLVFLWFSQHPHGLWHCNGEYFYFPRRLFTAWINVLRGL